MTKPSENIDGNSTEFCSYPSIAENSVIPNSNKSQMEKPEPELEAQQDDTNRYATDYTLTIIVASVDG